MRLSIRNGAALAILLLAGLATTGCDFGGHDAAKCAADNATHKANFEAQLKLNEVQLEAQKRITMLQLDVAKRCADRGWIPVYINQNVGCNAPK